MPEEFPIKSVYINRLAGRTAFDSRLHYTRQSSSVLLAHKTTDFTCHPPGPQFDPPRTSQLEAVGIVVSQKHPPSATFLAPAMAEHLLHRCARCVELCVEAPSSIYFSPTGPVLIPFFFASHAETILLIRPACFALRSSMLPSHLLRRQVHDGGRQGTGYCFRA